MSYKSCITSGFYVFIDCQIRELTEGMGREHKHYQIKSPKRNPGPQLDLSIFLESFSKLLCFSFVRFSMLQCTPIYVFVHATCIFSLLCHPWIPYITTISTHLCVQLWYVLHAQSLPHVQRRSRVPSYMFCTWNALARWFDSLKQIPEGIPYAWHKQWYIIWG